MPLIRKDAAPVAASTEPNAATIALLRSGSDDERFAAARSLSGKAAATAALGEALSGEEDARVREAILTGLARIGTAESAELILPLIRSDNASVRTGALDALALMPDAVGPHLAGLLADTDTDVRLLACELARRMPSPRASQLICALLARETQVNVCAAALDVLAEVGGPEALPVLAVCQARFADEPFLAFALRVAAERVGAKPAEFRG